MTRALRTTVIAVIAVALGAGLFLLGRLTSDPGDGHTADYFAGLRAGESRGVQEGRALQLTESLPQDSRAAARAAFDSGYAAGANDAFGGYDGGWYASRPYVITLAKGRGPITYDISSRTLMHRGVDYYVCGPAGKICERHQE